MILFLKLIFIGVQLLCNVVLVSTVQQNESAIHIHIFPLFGFPSHLDHRHAFSRVPCATQYVLISCLFYTQYQQCVCVNPNLPTPPTPPAPCFSLGIHTFVFYVCVSISALQTRSSIPFFQIPHICINTLYLFFSF